MHLSLMLSKRLAPFAVAPSFGLSVCCATVCSRILLTLFVSHSSASYVLHQSIRFCFQICSVLRNCAYAHSAIVQHLLASCVLGCFCFSVGFCTKTWRPRIHIPYHTLGFDLYILRYQIIGAPCSQSTIYGPESKSLVRTLENRDTVITKIRKRSSINVDNGDRIPYLNSPWYCAERRGIAMERVFLERNNSTPRKSLAIATHHIPVHKDTTSDVSCMNEVQRTCYVPQ